MANELEGAERLVDAEFLQADDGDQHGSERTRRHIRRRAFGDALLVLGGTVVVTMPVANPHDSLLVGIAAVSVGIMYFLIRRNHDLKALSRADRWRDRRLEGRGMPLAQWHQGTTLPSWAERRLDPLK